MTSPRSVFAALAARLPHCPAAAVRPSPPPAPSDAERADAVRTLAAQRAPCARRDGHARSRTASSRSIPKKVSAPTSATRCRRRPRRASSLIRGGIYPVYLAMESFGAFLDRDGLSRGPDPHAARARLVASPVRKRARDRGPDRLVLRARGRAPDDDRPQPGRHPGGQGAARATRATGRASSIRSTR